MDRPPGAFTPLLHTIVERLQAQPTQCALRFNGSDISNGVLLNAVNSAAAGLRAAGIAPGVRVGVCVERSPDLLVLLLALWANAAVYVPLDPDLPRERLFTMCETAELEVLLTQPALRAKVASLPCALLDATALVAAPSAPATGSVSTRTLAADDLAYILFTSGSSGAPKGVTITHGNIAALFAAVLPLLELPQACRVLGCANPGFDIAFFELLAPLLCGGTLVLADRQTCASAPKLVDLIANEAIDVVQATPSHWQLLNALPWRVPVSIALATGEALLRDTAAGILQRATRVWNLYGPTECTLWSSAHRVTTTDLVPTAPAIVSIGSALPGYILELDTTKPHGIGELLISGGGISPGYCGTQDSSQGFHQAGPAARRTYRSGDLCRYDASGLLHYVGRRDNQVKHNGYRIELDEIARLLRQHMSIREAVCRIRPAHDARPSLLFACVVFRRGMPNRNKTTLNGYLATWLPTWMLPQRYFFLEALPLNANGKLDTAALLALTGTIERNAGGDSLATRVARVFCEVLDIDSIGPCDSFLDAGGSSMLAATLVLSLNERLGCALSLRDVLATPPTVASIVHLLQASTLSAAS